MGALDRMRFDIDPNPGGLHQEFKYDEAQDILVVRSVQDVEPFLEATKALRREADEGNKGYSPSRELRRVASVPPILAHKWLQEGVNILDDEHWDAVAARLDDPDYAYCRTAPGHVGTRPHRRYAKTEPR
jgi:hypothetical protein